MGISDYYRIMFPIIGYNKKTRPYLLLRGEATISFLNVQDMEIEDIIIDLEFVH